MTSRLSEPQNAEPAVAKEGVTPAIAPFLLRFEMLAAIDLDHQLRRMADEIHDVAADRDWRRKLAPFIR